MKTVAQELVEALHALKKLSSAAIDYEFLSCSNEAYTSTHPIVKRLREAEEEAQKILNRFPNIKG